MAQERSDVPTSEYYKVAIGQGMYTSDLASNIPDGFSAVCYNMVATGDSFENRIGIRRSSVDWKIQQFYTGSAQYQNIFSQIAPWSNDPALPAFMWSSQGYSVPGNVLNQPSLNLIRGDGTHDASDGFMSVDTTAFGGLVSGICQYNDTIYFCIPGNGVYKITGINWAADSLTAAAIPSSATGTFINMFTFKDRIWGYNEEVLYFTNLPAVGGQPETWAYATNRVSFVGSQGAGAIRKVVPLGNRLAVFTTNGLFTLLVEGDPASWILRVLDSKSISTTIPCAFESKGVIYYVNTQGVWATNTLKCQKLSPTIEDQFFQAKGTRIHMICPYEDGMIVSVSKLNTDGSKDKTNCRVFYSKLDPIAWAEWNVNRNDLGTGDYQLAGIFSTTDKIPTYLNSDPTVYAIAFYTDSTELSPQKTVVQLLIMDGGQDQWVTRANVVETLPVGIYMKTKHFDGGNPYNYKQALKGMIEMYTSDAQHEVTLSWDLDATTSVATEVRTKMVQDFTVGVGSNLIAVQADFQYRRMSMNVRAELQTNESQIKIKDIAIQQSASRDVHELVQ